jgi:beta-lactamase class A
MTLQDRLDAALAPTRERVDWSVAVLDEREQVLAAHGPATVLPTASMGKVLLLHAAALAMQAGDLDEREPLAVEAQDEVADSGLWQHLRTRTLPACDVAALVGAVSDNVATNVLLRRIGLDTVDGVRRNLGLDGTRLLDRIRDQRTPSDPSAPSVGRADELAGLMLRLEQGRAIDPTASARTRGWLALGTDLSMVAASFGLDPLAHADRLANKTGTDLGVRADAGSWRRPDGTVVSYAALAHWTTPRQATTAPAAPAEDAALAAAVITAMCDLGAALAG